jgi:hypothetical protein
MKNLISGMMYGKSNKANGLMALIVVSLIALGCTCGKGFEELTKKDSSGPSNTFGYADDREHRKRKTIIRRPMRRKRRFLQTQKCRIS